jgi:hypothetical protein
MRRVARAVGGSAAPAEAQPVARRCRCTTGVTGGSEWPGAVGVRAAPLRQATAGGQTVGRRRRWTRAGFRRAASGNRRRGTDAAGEAATSAASPARGHRRTGVDGPRGDPRRRRRGIAARRVVQTVGLQTRARTVAPGCASTTGIVASVTSGRLHPTIGNRCVRRPAIVALRRRVGVDRGRWRIWRDPRRDGAICGVGPCPVSPWRGNSLRRHGLFRGGRWAGADGVQQWQLVRRVRW